MGRAVNLSPLGLYQWDNTLFDLMTIPSALDKPTLIDNLLAETAELEVLYPNPVVFKNLLGVWSAKNLDVWNRLYQTTQYEYNPIENYNRYETGSNGDSGSTTHSGTDTTGKTETHSGTDTNTGSETHSGTDRRVIDKDWTGHDTTEGTTKNGHWIAGYDAPAPTAQDDGLFKQTRDEGESESTITFNSSEDVTDALTHGESISKSGSVTHGESISETGSITHGEKVVTSNEGSHELHAHGNIGVTTTQKLIREQREVDLFNLYDIIIEDFKMRFCILVY